jgi:DegV family protein with EDD domain
MIKIITDSTSDVPSNIVTELGISIVPVLVETDGVTLLDGVTLSREEFYAKLEQYRTIPRTASPSPADIATVYRTAKAAGADEIISIHVNRKFSGLCAAAEAAAREVAEEGLPVHVVDSEATSMGLGWQAIIAARMAREGASVEQILPHLEKMRPHVCMYAIMDTLKYLRKSGRANALVAGVGDMLQLKILLSVQNGVVNQIDRIRTRPRCLARMVDVVHDRHHSLQHLSVIHTTNGQEKDTAYLSEQFKDLMPQDKQFDMQVTPVLGAHVGPMSLGVIVVDNV